MKHLLSLIFIVTAHFSLSAQGGDVEKRGIRVTGSAQVEGDWRCVQTDLIVEQEVSPSDIHLHDLRIKGDTTWLLEYPCRFYALVVADSDSTENKMWFLHDTLVILSNGYDTDGYRRYVRDTFDQKIFTALVRDTFYLPVLFGKWYLETQRCMDYSGEPPWPVTYPVYMPPVYKLDAGDVISRNTLLMNINGTLRKFRVVDCSVCHGTLVLEADGWAKQPFYVTYFSEYPMSDECGNKIIYR